MSIVNNPSYQCDHCEASLGQVDDGMNEGYELEDQMYIGSQGALHLCDSCSYEYRSFFCYAE